MKNIKLDGKEATKPSEYVNACRDISSGKETIL
jgi:hypothetical protein